MGALTFTVLGTPAPQGSKRGFYNSRLRRVQLVDDNKTALQDWRGDIVRAATEALPGTGDPAADLGQPMFTGAVRVDIEFRFNRPKSHYGTGGNAHLVKASAPLFPTGKPDADKLLRSVFDALTAAHMWRDDAQVAYLHARKVYADAHPPGATILIEHHGDTADTDLAQLLDTLGLNEEAG